MPLTLRGILQAALAAGLVAGLFFFAVQAVTTRPLIVRAEVFERAEQREAPQAAHGHADAEHAWEPAEGVERAAYTLAADVLIGVGYAFLLVGAIGVSGRAVTLRSGLAWGAAGFLVFVAAPSLGLPPEPPGGHPADLLARQVWWLGTACATAAGLWLAARRGQPWLRGTGVMLLAVPHLIGAPQPVAVSAGAHAALAVQFVWASLAANAALWATLGLAVGWLLPRLGRVPVAVSAEAQV